MHVVIRLWLAIYCLKAILSRVFMSKTPLERLSDTVTESHKKIQNDFESINPVVSVTTKMRGVGIPADVMMIDCLVTKRRILIVLNDEQPDSFSYQFCMKEEDPLDQFMVLPLTDLTETLIYDWIAGYFSENKD